MRQADCSVGPLQAAPARSHRQIVILRAGQEALGDPAMDRNASEILCAQDASFDPNQLDRNQKPAVRRRFRHKRSFRQPVYRRFGLGVLDRAEKSRNRVLESVKERMLPAASVKGRPKS
jgi:hypothetical protein